MQHASGPVVHGRVWKLLVIGLLAGFFSGLFGVGGGIVIVPLLIMWLGSDPRLASGTSLTAILPTAVAGAIGYAARGDVDWLIALLLAGGAIVGSFVGSWLLSIINQGVLRWIFIAFQLTMAVQLFLLVPDRGASVPIDPLMGLLIIGIGLFTGIMSGLLGVGGGVIVVPLMMVIIGMGDLVAKGTSLIMMIPTAITGTVMNARRGNTDVRAALLMGALAIPASFLGIAVAVAIPPQLGSVLFAVLLLFTASQLAIRALKARRQR